MSKHTPGPWEHEVHELSEGFSAIVYGSNGQRIGTDHLSEANARLIAAAPDLLAALRDMVGQHDLNPERLLSAMHLWDAARAAIAKAEGR